MSNEDRIQEGSCIKIVNKDSPYYMWRGKVTVVNSDEIGVSSYECTIHNPIDGKDAKNARIIFEPSSVELIQKKFVDIERVVEKDEEIAEGIIKKRNCDNFFAGEDIQISEKIDGANASFCYDKDSGKLAVFSRNNELGMGGLNGFYEYITLRFKAEDFKEEPYCNYAFFGEWLISHTVKYDKENYGKWYTYDVYDKDTCRYLNQTEVKKLCEKFSFIYVHVLYEGPFVSWEHCRSFCHTPAYGESQEGVVIKLQSNKPSVNPRHPRVLKIVNDEFIETKHIKKSIREAKTPEQLAEEAAALEKMNSIVTKNRVLKELHKCRDENLLPSEITPRDIGKILKILPKRIFDDCVKEEPETLQAAGENAGKLCAKLTVQYVREIVLGIS